MRILLTADPIGGVWSYTLELCGGLAAHGVEVVLATLGAPLARSQRAAVEACANVELHESEYRLEWMSDPWKDVDEAGDWLLAIESDCRPDLVHLNHLVHAELPWFVPVLSVGHSCVLSWWAAVHREPAPADWAAYRGRVIRSLTAAQRVVAPTHAMLGELQHYYGPLDRCVVIHNGRDPSLFAGGGDDKEPVILCAGRLWDRAKNVESLAAAAPVVDWPICVAGSGVGPGGAAAHLPLLRVLGFLDASALARWYRRASIYVLPARYEPFGLTALEAALSGCALVLGDIPSLREVWDDAALYVAPDDPDQLSAVLNGLIGDGARRRTLAARARARALEYSSRRCVNAYLALYRGMLSEHRTAAAREQSRLNAGRVSAARLPGGAP